MKICIISSFYPPFYFGGERAVQREAESLAVRGNQVSLLTSSPSRHSYVEEINHVMVHRIAPFNIYPPFEFSGRRGLMKPLFHLLDMWNPFSAARLRKALQGIEPDVVYIHNFKGLSSTVFNVVKSLGLPSVFSADDYSLICPRANLLRSSGNLCVNPALLCRLYARTQRQIFSKNKPDLVIANAQFILDKFKQAAFFSGIHSVKEVVGVEPIGKNTKKDYSIINILYVGGVNKHKGVQVLIKAVLNLNHANVRLHIVGTGQDLNEIKALAGDDPRITFHGFISDDDLSSLRRNTNICVVPSIWFDMAQGVICESFSFGIPVIGSRIGGIPEFIEEGNNGLLFEPGNYDELKAILERLTINTSELKKLEEGAINSSTKYDIAKHVNRLEELFRRVISEYHD